MDKQPIEDMEVFLKPTKFCDCNNREIINKVKELTKKDKTPKEMVLSIFNFVRDKITSTMCENDRAFQTLEKRYGDCDTKTNLQVALLRAINIPVRYYIASLRKE